MMTRAAATVATLALMGGAGIVAATAAGASTAACTTTGPLAGSCGDEVNMYGNGFNVYQQRAAADTKIIAYPDFNMSATPPSEITNDRALDFYAVNTTADPNERVFIYAPNGVRTNLAISDPMGGVPGDSRDGLVLRTYNPASKFQQFTGLGNTQNTSGIQWQNAASKLIVAPNGTGAQLTGKSVAVAATSQGSYFGWNQPGVVPAAG